jgi:hypothetical protein
MPSELNSFSQRKRKRGREGEQATKFFRGYFLNVLSGCLEYFIPFFEN